MVDKLVCFCWQVDQWHLKTVHRWYARSQGLRDLAHTLGHVLIRLEHVSLSHEESDIAARCAEQV